MTLEGGATTITRRLTFASGHRVMGHETKCAHLHGHNYVAEILAEADYLDSLGRVVDFSVLKDKIGGWIDAHWDHGMILFAEDHAALLAVAQFEALMEPAGFKQKLYVLSSNPTAENMARELAQRARQLLFGSGVRIVSVRLHETENCLAEYVV
jgi:6-pyruvoyltetrahydropterin/6-carboxytetrahydropterin synthase